MPPRRAVIPAYQKEGNTGRARMFIYDASGKRRSISLGTYGSPESLKAYADMLALHVVSPPPVPKKVPSFRPKKNALVGEICAAYLEHAATYYRREDGTQTNEYRLTVTIVSALEPEHGSSAAKFGRATLAAIRERMIAKGWTRQHVNAQVRRVRTMWRWAEEHELLPEGSWGRLMILRGLKKGRSAAPEESEIQPVSDADIAATLPHLSPTVARMVRFHRLTACRPQDVCGLAWEWIDRTAAVWVYSPKQHKTAHLSHARGLLIGPAAQGVMGEPAVTGFVFSPRAALAEVNAARRANRKTKLYPSHLAEIERKRNTGPKRTPGERFSVQAYCRAIERACVRAGIAPWSPNQLRHAALTDLRAKFGLEVARAVAGHRNAATTERYADPSMGAARKAMEAVG